MVTLDGRRILITGGGTGVGRSVALAFAEQGSRVVISGRREEKLLEAAGLWSGPNRIQVHAADVSDRHQVDTLCDFTLEALGGVDILVNCAGANVRNRSLAELDPEDWDRLLRINASGAFYCMRRVLPGMRERRDGVIVNISSVAGKRAVLLGGVAYNASKFAMTALGTSAWLEEGKNCIRVTNVYPGEINTPILDDRPVPVSDEHRARILQPEDVAETVLLVARLPARAHIPEIVIKPTHQDYA